MYKHEENWRCKPAMTQRKNLGKVLNLATTCTELDLLVLSLIMLCFGLRHIVLTPSMMQHLSGVAVTQCLHLGRGLIPTPSVYSAAISLGKECTVHYLVFSDGVLNRRSCVCAHITLHT